MNAKILNNDISEPSQAGDTAIFVLSPETAWPAIHQSLRRRKRQYHHQRSERLERSGVHRNERALH
jgi:hypothetical protein